MTVWSDDQNKYAAWKAEVEKHLLRLCAMESEDMPDFNYKGAFNKGWSPEKTAKKAIAWGKTF